jgi:hypothetical protein
MPTAFNRKVKETLMLKSIVNRDNWDTRGISIINTKSFGKSTNYTADGQHLSRVF